MTSSSSSLLVSSNYSIAFIIITLFLFVSASYSTTHKYHYTFRGLMLAEEKARLGSTPPSCHNKCNQCHPCSAVQVPTQPSRHPDPAREKYSAPAAEYNRYSNYKPLGWKCDCDGHYYNP